MDYFHFALDALTANRLSLLIALPRKRTAAPVVKREILSFRQGESAAVNQKVSHFLGLRIIVRK
jgi:hypothetical protein